MARAQTQGCRGGSNPRDPRRGRQRLDHCLPDRGGEGLQGQLVRLHQEGQATGGLPFHRVGSEVPEALLEPGVGAGLTCILRALRGRWGETGRQEEKARPGEARSEPEVETEDPPSDPAPGTSALPAPPGHRRPPPPSLPGTPLSTPSLRPLLQGPGPRGTFPAKPLCPRPQTPSRKVQEEKERARFGAPVSELGEAVPPALQGREWPQL